ncbi:alanine racemase [Pajaroellobacter abortibovis]|uniref:Alanine racemase n=1 Tax=Pajaroellobacter abortibovis TaxID=1882918 RepID=A0A1L6MZK7_9BACT|nr:alanine racemase [Pajaroellobacter abortibovis]
MRPTRAEVNLAALRHNLRVLKRLARETPVWGVVKADAYGHGAPAVARTLERMGIAGFCVALPEEAFELRNSGIQIPILVMGGCYGSVYADLLAYQLTPVIYDFRDVEGFARLVRAGFSGGPIDVHLKVDTGMGRLGVTMRDLRSFASRLTSYPQVRVYGVMSHFASADIPSSEMMVEQVARLEEATAILSSYGIQPVLRHIANSAALFRKCTPLDAVRPGIALFGIPPKAKAYETEWERIGFESWLDLKPVMRVRSEIVALREVEMGDSVSYGALWTAGRLSRIATVPMGYADGLSRRLSNRGYALVRGKRARMVGAVSMDMVMLDVTEHPGVSVGDEVVILGSQQGPLGKDHIEPAEIADQSGTIPWEVLTSISRRVPRFYREP